MIKVLLISIYKGTSHLLLLLSSRRRCVTRIDRNFSYGSLHVIMAEINNLLGSSLLEGLFNVLYKNPSFHLLILVCNIAGHHHCHSFFLMFFVYILLCCLYFYVSNFLLYCFCNFLVYVFLLFFLIYFPFQFCLF